MYLETIPEAMCDCIVSFENKKMPPVPKNPGRILAVDPGLVNFAACVTNTACRPLLIDGRQLMSANRFFNKEYKRLLGQLPKGQSTSSRIEAMIKKRNNRIWDFFFKAAHVICRYADHEHVELILYGFTNDRSGNEDILFPIPYGTFFQILRWVASGYSIAVDLQEESSTSEMDFLAGTDSEETCVMCGKRIFRGLYHSRTGAVINADVNAAANILKKRKPDAFLGVSPDSLLSVSVIRYGDLYHPKSITSD